jgi:hypothetical protein
MCSASKHWAYGNVWKLLQPLLFWQGDAAHIDSNDLKTTKARLTPVKDMGPDDVLASLHEPAAPVTQAR